VRDMESFLTEYFSSVVLALHASASRVVPGAHRVVVLVPTDVVGPGRSIRQAPEYFVVEKDSFE
jgi:hypothetical protein